MSERALLVPSRAPDTTLTYVYKGPGPDGLATIDFWQSSDTELGLERTTITTYPDNPRAANVGIVSKIDALATIGMRPVFEAAGIHTARRVERIDANTEVHELYMTFASVRQIARDSQSRAASATDRTHFTVRPTNPHRYDPIVWVGHGAQKERLMSLEDPSRPADKDDAWHDRSIHDPAWYCLPPFVTTGIYRQMVRRQEQYEEAIALPAGRKRDKAVELVRRESTLFADDLEVVNTLSVAELYMPTDRPYHDISMRLGTIIGERPEVVEAAIQEHIRDPKPENILVASFI